MKFFSIIVPIYNVDKYIEECINSVLEQKYDNYELILVDDGSTDNSGMICDKYAEKNQNIIVIHKKNGGVSDARNIGIDRAQGKYIVFLDGDDVLTSNCLQNINTILNNELIDILICNFNVYGKDIKNEKMDIKSINTISDYINLFNDIPCSAWRNVYRKNLIDKYKIKFTKGLIGAEDCDFFMRIFEKSKKITCTNFPIINYRVNREGSITNNINFNVVYGQLKIFSDNFYKYYNKNNTEILELFSKKYLNAISTINGINDKSELKDIYQEINKNKIIFKYAHGIKYNIYKIIWLIFGYKLGSKIIDFIRH